MSASPEVISMKVRPLESAHLCFEVDGILGETYAPNAAQMGMPPILSWLGAQVTPFDFTALYTTLMSVPTVSGEPSLLFYNFLEIQNYVLTGPPGYPPKPNTSTLFSLRAEPMKAALQKAINARQNAYFAKYSHAASTTIIKQMTESYSQTKTGAKLERLEQLSQIADHQWNELKGAYEKDKRTRVVRTTESVLTSNTWSHGMTRDQGQTDGASLVANVAPPVTLPRLPPGGLQLGVGTFHDGDEDPALTIEEGTSGDTSKNKEFVHEHQKIVNTDYGYRVPFLENEAQYHRAKISLIDQICAHVASNQNLKDLDTVFKNELNSIDRDIYRLQIAYLNTFLISPIYGTVTGVYKNIGEVVRAGEPIVRVENNSMILLVAVLKYRGKISTDNRVQIVVTKLYEELPLVTLDGHVVAVRGHLEDDRWEIIIRCVNVDSTGNTIVPFGYRFDHDNITSFTLL